MMLGSGLSVPQSVSMDSLLPLTSPQTPVLCMLPPAASSATCPASNSNPVALLEAAAAQMKRKFLSFALLDEEHLDDLMVELSQVACEDSWVVVEHCHLYNNSKQALQQIIKVHTCTLKQNLCSSEQ